MILFQALYMIKVYANKKRMSLIYFATLSVEICCLLPKFEAVFTLLWALPSVEEGRINGLPTISSCHCQNSPNFPRLLPKEEDWSLGVALSDSTSSGHSWRDPFRGPNYSQPMYAKNESSGGNQSFS